MSEKPLQNLMFYVKIFIYKVMNSANIFVRPVTPQVRNSILFGTAFCGLYGDSSACFFELGVVNTLEEMQAERNIMGAERAENATMLEELKTLKAQLEVSQAAIPVEMNITEEVTATDDAEQVRSLKC